ncbi:unnamed protein product [Ilex paraguariensis]|uniref:Uncharacterized protein n=1 Tax=Ilex paraguariensis TaxID=185542 RepID=A0ABC8QR47_9AQUA
MRVQRIDSLVVPWRTPPLVPENMKELGSLSLLPNQSITTISSSVDSDEASQLKPTKLKQVHNISPRKATEITVAEKNAKKLGLSQWFMPGTLSFWTSLRIFSNGFGRFGEAGSEITRVNASFEMVMVVAEVVEEEAAAEVVEEEVVVEEVEEAVVGMVGIKYGKRLGMA